MRVALAIHRVRPGGGQDRYALELARRLAASCELDLIALRVEGDLPPGVGVKRVSAPLRPMLLTAPLFRSGARSLARAGRYDLVHTVGGALPGANVVTAQFCAAEWRRLNTDADWYQRLVMAQAVRDERAAYRDPALAAVIAVSRRTAGEVERHYGPLSAPVYVIPNAVDLDAFAPRAAAPRPRPRLLFVGAFERKGLDVAIRALARLEHDAELLAVGGGDVPRYRALAASLGVAGRVTLQPPRSDIAAVFADADVFVFPTRYEPFGMVIAEALASGLPVVTSARAGAADLIRDGESGWIVTDPEDAAGFAAAVDRVLEDDAARAAMARAARAAVKGLTWDSVAAQTLDVYRSAAGAPAPGAAVPSPGAAAGA
ncbi:MAG TPA: glycosyltransferase family 4 protein [Gemmatimonadales bacterium]|nr:glycosyltransferase family 4 protein [Gemmatimonadales bacterium]